MAQASDVILVEVGPRDGLQYESGFFPTQRKIALVDLLSRTGLKRIEVTSFVHPKAVPQLADAAQVLSGITKRAGVTYSALVPNIKGCQAALATPVDELALFVSASETHNQKNVNQSVAESLAGLAEVARLGREAGRRLRGYIVTAFGCPYEGRIPRARLTAILEAYAAMGVAEVSLGDTTGMANPVLVAEQAAWLIAGGWPLDIAFHFHDSRGLGLANVAAAYQAGILIFDASVGGVGGCPTAIGAAGNVDTLDLVNLFEEMGVSTGVDFAGLREAAALIAAELAAQLPSRTFKQGRPQWQDPAGWRA
ncbi:MAG: hydroxymethylglutaryl-CoA lyase [Pseudomonadota bacterium]